MAEEGEKKATEYQMTREHTYKIVTSFMPEAFEQDAIKISLVAVDKFKHLKDIAFYIKQQYDRKYPGSGKAAEGVYHCAVGKSFASAVSHETRRMIHLKVDTLHVVLWKAKEAPFQDAD